MPRRTGKYGSVVNRNLTVLGFLVNHGTWANANQIRLGSGGFNPADVNDTLDSFIVRKYVESRPAPNRQAKTEYRSTEKGRQMLKELLGFLGKWTGTSHMLGIPGSGHELGIIETDHDLELPEHEEKKEIENKETK